MGRFLSGVLQFLFAVRFLQYVFAVRYARVLINTFEVTAPIFSAFTQLEWQHALMACCYGVTAMAVHQPDNRTGRESLYFM